MIYIEEKYLIRIDFVQRYGSDASLDSNSSKFYDQVIHVHYMCVKTSNVKFLATLRIAVIVSFESEMLLLELVDCKFRLSDCTIIEPDISACPKLEEPSQI